MRKRSRSGGVRNPGRKAAVWALIFAGSVALIVFDVVGMRETGRSSSALMFASIPALLGPFFFIRYLGMSRAVRDMRNGQRMIARWVVPAAQFSRFCENDRRIPPGSVMTNFYRPPRKVPVEGVEVIFAPDGVLIGGGYFPLSVTGGRRLQAVRTVYSDPPTIEFETIMNARTGNSRGTVNTSGLLETLRIPTTQDAAGQVGVVLRHFQAALGASGGAQG